MLISFITSILFVLFFFGCCFIYQSHFYLRPFKIILGFLTFFLANLVILPISVYTHWVLTLFLVLLFVIYGIRFCFVNKVIRISAILLIIGSGYLTFIPVSDTDSLSYVLPMASNALTYDTIGTWSTFNFRSIFRFWGPTAIVSNFLCISQGNTAAVQVVSLLTLFSLAFSTFILSRYLVSKFSLNINKNYLFLSFIFLVLNPFLFNSVYTLQTDTFFAACILSSLILILFNIRSQKSSLFFLISCLGIISSKAFWFIYFLSISPLLLKKRIFVKYSLISILAFITVCIYNYNRISTYFDYTYSLVETPTIKNLSGAFLGLAPYEAGVQMRPESSVHDIEGQNLLHSLILKKYVWSVYTDYGFNSFLSLIKKPFDHNNDIFYYNNSSPNIFIFITFTGLVFLFLHFSNNISRLRHSKILTPLLLFIFPLLFFLMFYFVIQGAALNHYRYLYAPWIILTIPGLLFLLQYRKIFLFYIICSLSLFLLQVTHPASVQPIYYTLQTKQQSFPAFVKSFNQVLETHDKINDFINYNNTRNNIISSPLYPGFSSQYIITDNYYNSIYETFPTTEAIDFYQVYLDSPIILMNSQWNINYAGANLDLLKSVLPSDYKFVRPIFRGQIVVFYKEHPK